MRVWKDPELEKFNAAWQRRGELMVASGLSGLFVWLAAALPTASTTHVNIWPPLAVAAVIAVAGLYALVAAEWKRLWLPGRSAVRKGVVGRAMRAGMDELHERSSHAALQEVTVHISRERPPPIMAPATYQVDGLRQAVAALMDAGLREFASSQIDLALGRVPRSGKNPLFEPLRVFGCHDGIAALIRLF